MWLWCCWKNNRVGCYSPNPIKYTKIRLIWPKSRLTGCWILPPRRGCSTRSWCSNSTAAKTRCHRQTRTRQRHRGMLYGTWEHFQWDPSSSKVIGKHFYGKTKGMWVFLGTVIGTEVLPVGRAATWCLAACCLTPCLHAAHLPMMLWVSFKSRLTNTAVVPACTHPVAPCRGQTWLNRA